MLVRKLVLRGYRVVVLARNRAEVAQALPSSVQIVEGNIGSAQACRTAIQGIDKACDILLEYFGCESCLPDSVKCAGSSRCSVSFSGDRRLPETHTCILAQQDRGLRWHRSARLYLSYWRSAAGETVNGEGTDIT